MTYKRFPLALLLAAGVAVLGGCASPPYADSVQTVQDDQCVAVVRAEGTYKVCPTSMKTGRRMGYVSTQGYCKMALDIREDGSVSTVKVFGVSPRTLEPICRRSAYEWRFAASKDGERVPLDGFVAGLQMRRIAEPTPDVEAGRMTVSFDTADIDAYTVR